MNTSKSVKWKTARRDTPYVFQRSRRCIYYKTNPLVCVCVHVQRRQLGASCVAVKGSVCTLLHLSFALAHPPRLTYLFRRFAKRREKARLQLHHRNRVLSRGRASGTKKIVLCAPRAMKFEFTRAQLMPAKFIGRDGKCAFHDCRQVTPSYHPLRSASPSSWKPRVKLADCYLNPLSHNWLLVKEYHCGRTSPFFLSAIRVYDQGWKE